MVRIRTGRAGLNSSVTTHLFLWSLPDEPEIPDAWTRQYGRFMVYPITYAAMLAARRIFAPGFIEDPANLVDATNRHDLYEKSLRDTDALMDVLSGDPVLAGIDPGFVYFALFHRYLFTEMMSEARRRHGQGPVVVLPLFSKSAAPALLVKVAQSLDLAASEANWFHRVGRGVRIRHAVLRPVGRAWCAVSRLRRQWTVRRPARMVDILLVGFEGADRRNQNALFDRLRNEPGVIVHWIRPVGERFQLTADEKARESGVSGSDGIEDVEWDGLVNKQQVRRSRWFRDVLRIRMSDALRSLPQLDLSPQGAYTLTEQFSDPGLSAKQRVVQSVLDRYQSRVTVLSASHQLNRLARIWTRERNSLSVRLPHGVEYFRYMRCWWDFDAVGMPGRRSMRDFSTSRHGEGTITGLVGGMGHASQFRIASSSSGSGSTARVVLYPLSFISYIFPDLPTEHERDLSVLLNALSGQGYRLRLRNHPRAGMWMPDDYTRLHRELRHDGFEIGDSGRSLAEDLSGCRFVLARHWGGAIVQALYARTPVIAWLPRPGTTYSDEILGSFPMVARTPDEVAAWLERLDTTSVVEDVLRKQDELLADLFEDPYNDFPERAATFILDVLKAKRECRLRADS